MTRYRVGLIGLGHIACRFERDPKARRYYPALTHAGSFAQHPKTRIVCGCDRDPQRLREFGRTWGVRGLYRDYRTMLRGESLDILSVCTGPEAHLDVIR